MKKGLIAAALVGLLGAFGVGCGDVCEDAADICGAGEDGGEDTAGGGEVECSGAPECTSQCIVDADSCDFTDETLAKCITDCAGAAGAE